MAFGIEGSTTTAGDQRAPRVVRCRELDDSGRELGPHLVGAPRSRRATGDHRASRCPRPGRSGSSANCQVRPPLPEWLVTIALSGVSPANGAPAR